jgi:putative thioredoxin
MIDITLQNLQTELIEASQRQPVLLDIWAPWCGPCKSLGPVLEKLEAEYAGAFLLAKLNSDEEQEIAGQLSQMFGVRSIPFCVMFSQGQPVDGFVGAIPEAQIREFLAKHVATPEQQEAEATVEEAEEVLASGGDVHDLVTKLAAAVEADPANDVAWLDYLKVLLGLARAEPARVQQARAAFNHVAPKALADNRFSAIEHWLKAAEAKQAARSDEALQAAISANRRDFAARFELAQKRFAAGSFTDAMDELLEILLRDKTWNQEAARKTYVAILELMTKPAPKPAPDAAGKPTLELTGKAAIAPADPVLDGYRRKLSMAWNC